MKLFLNNKLFTVGTCLLIVSFMFSLSSCAYYKSVNAEAGKPLPSEYVPKTNMAVLVDPLNLPESLNGFPKDSDEPMTLDLKSATIMAFKNSVSFNEQWGHPSVFQLLNRQEIGSLLP